MTRSGTLNKIQEAWTSFKALVVSAVVLALVAGVFYAVSIAIWTNVTTPISAATGPLEGFVYFSQIFATLAGFVGLLCLMIAFCTGITIVILYASLPFSSSKIFNLETESAKRYGGGSI